MVSPAAVLSEVLAADPAAQYAGGVHCSMESTRSKPAPATTTGGRHYLVPPQSHHPAAATWAACDPQRGTGTHTAGVDAAGVAVVRVLLRILARAPPAQLVVKHAEPGVVAALQQRSGLFAAVQHAPEQGRAKPL